MNFSDFCKEKNIECESEYDFGSTRGYKTKGVVKYYIELSNRDKLLELLRYVEDKSIKLVPSGGGSNILIKDHFDGVFVNWVEGDIKIISETNNGILLSSSAGIEKSNLIDYCIDNELSGLEFWAGIPGDVGGGIAMNLGAYGCEVKDYANELEIATPDGFVNKKGSELNWSYRKVDLPKNSIITSAVFKLKRRNTSEIKELVDSHIEDRKSKHPLDFPSCGSVFKNPENSNKESWQLIREAGLEGFNINGAMISDVHTNFIINTGSATASDILSLIKQVKYRVRDKFGVELEEELRIY